MRKIGRAVLAMGICLGAALALAAPREAAAQGSFIKRGQEKQEEREAEQNRKPPTPVPQRPATAPAGTPAPAAPATAPGVVEPLRATLTALRSGNLRDRPSTEGAVLGGLQPGQTYAVEGRVRQTDRTWLMVRLGDGRAAYAAETLLGTPAAFAAILRAQQESAAAQFTTAAAPSVGIDTGEIVADGRTIRLYGVIGRTGPSRAGFAAWLNRETVNGITCAPQGESQMQCFSRTGFDLAEAVLLNGAGQAVDGSSDIYRAAEEQAKQAKRGVWRQ